MKPEQVPGLIPESTGHLLRRLARQVPADRLIVEIGAYQGRSTCYLATGSAEGHQTRVVSIDPWDAGILPGPRNRGIDYLDSKVEAAYHHHLAACGVAHLVTPLKGMSQQVPLPSGPVGLLWIDGAHDYDAVTADIGRYTPLVLAGGWVVVDDYRAHSRGVDRAVRELMRAQPQWWEWDTKLRPLAVGRRR